MEQRDLRRSAAAAAPSYPIKKESHCFSKRKKDHHHQVSGGITASMPDDVLADIFTRLRDMATVVRCAATCRRWGHLVATRAAVISPCMPPLGRFFPSLAVGLFHQENDWPPTTRTRDPPSQRPCFIATASGTRFIRGDGQSSLAILGLDGGDRLLDHSRPIASRNGRLVLELRRNQDHESDGLRLAICNPMMLDKIDVIPPLVLVGKNTTKILDYGCALLTGHDLNPPCHQDFFHILLIYSHNHPGGQSTVLRCYSSDTGRWGPETESIVKIPISKIGNIGPAVVRRGVAFWALEQGVLGVRLDLKDHTMDMHMVPCDTSRTGPNNRLMGISPDNRLYLMYYGYMGAPLGKLVLKLTYLEFPNEDDMQTGKICRKCRIVLVEQMGKLMMVVTRYVRTIKLWWFGEKSGILLFTMGEGSGQPGTYMLKLEENAVDKLADDGHLWKNLLGYEMDMTAYLTSFSSGIYSSNE
ncbi:hypothetical protein CFC21_044653 [Triticum aestivum]|uniref:F-box domain-containing protein n=2 Tax=Triticum aestivum TaxID=4565 RepID=A0A9R1FRF6_WHEAT|nr:hypothetical protein CFC21_044653 [Triticum aestivum]CDJ26400.1 unnamed protein product [Triticum aestivum]